MGFTPAPAVADDDLEVLAYTEGEWPARSSPDRRAQWLGGSEDDPPPEYITGFDLWLPPNANVDEEIAELQSGLADLGTTVDESVDALGNRVASLEDGSALPPTGGFVRFSADDTWMVPEGVTRVRFRAKGPGGGAGGGGSAASTQLQVGGGGGGAGGLWDDWLDVQPGDTLEMVVPAGGVGGSGGAAGGNPGSNGTFGGQTTITHRRAGVTQTTVAVDGGGPGTGADASSATQVNGGSFSRNAFVSANSPTHPGAGGMSSQATTPMSGGLSGGTGGGVATATTGGNPGRAATARGCYSLNAPGATTQTGAAGADGQDATVPGAGGGGGGGGAAGTGKGGTGGDGGPGVVELWW